MTVFGARELSTGMRLSEEQEAALAAVSLAKENAQATADRLRDALKFQLFAVREDVRRAVVLAVEAGVPKSRIASEGLKTSDKGSVYRILEEGK